VLAVDSDPAKREHMVYLTGIPDPRLTPKR